MLNLRLIHHTKAALAGVMCFATVGALGGLVWLNQHGFEGEWGARIAAELSERGIHAQFRTVRFSPTRGIVARDVVIFRDPARQHVLAEIPRLRFEVDRGRALRGDLQIRHVSLHDASLTLPLGPDGRHSVHFTALSGRAGLDSEGRFLLEDAHGVLAGMPFRLAAELDEFSIDHFANRTGGGAASASRFDQSLAALFAELAHWSFPASVPPQLDLRLTGSLQRPSSLRTSFSFTAPELSRRAYTMEDVLVTGLLHGSTLAVDRLQFSDGSGSLAGSASYNLREHCGRYELNSSIKVADLLRRALDHHLLDDVVSANAPHLEARGRFDFDEGGLRLAVVGDLEWRRFRFLGIPFTGLKTEFSWRNDNLFLRNLTVTHEQGELTGRILVEEEMIRYEARSTLPVAAYRPFIGEGGGLDRSLQHSRFEASSSALVEAEGTIHRGDLRTWVAQGHATFERFSYNGVPVARADAAFEITPLESTFRNVEAEFDYADYPLRRRHGGPPSAVVRATEVRCDNETKLTHLSELRGTAWPAPVLRLFAPGAAAHVEREYGFRSPPEFVASGVIDARPPGARTDVTTRMRAHGTTDYRFLDRTLQLTELSSTVRTRHRRHDISNLSLRTLGGSAGGSITVHAHPGSPARYAGGIKWTDASLAAIGQKYDFEELAQGRITGRLDFEGVVGSTRSFNGKGVAGLRNGQLFHVPIFGPLSAPISGVLGDRRFSHEQARDASATFVIRDGVAYTNDFLTSTPSTVFTGEGRVDLATKQLDLTVRMNARGLLGLVTLPLRPFNGLFQFRGQGALKAPAWSSSPFTQPARGPRDPLFQVPPRARIVRER